MTEIPKDADALARELLEWQSGQRVYMHANEPNECSGVGGPLGSCRMPTPAQERDAALERAKNYDQMVRDAIAAKEAAEAQRDEAIARVMILTWALRAWHTPDDYCNVGERCTACDALNNSPFSVPSPKRIALLEEVAEKAKALVGANSEHNHTWDGWPCFCSGNKICEPQYYLRHALRDLSDEKKGV